MKTRDLKSLLNRAAAALETPKDLTSVERQELIDDLLDGGNELHDDAAEHLRVTLCVVYRNVEDTQALCSDLSKRLGIAISNGLLTGDGPEEVDTYQAVVTVLSDPDAEPVSKPSEISVPSSFDRPEPDFPWPYPDKTMQVAFDRPAFAAAAAAPTITLDANTVENVKLLLQDMGEVIRGLDDAGDCCELWLNDGDYIPDSRYANFIAALIAATRG